MNEQSVLLVDDDGEALLSLTRALKSALPEVTFNGAGNIQKAIQMQNQDRPLVAVIDLSLEASRGVTSGFELLETLKKNDPSIRIIVLTGHGSMEHGITSIKKGAASFLVKPADIQHLAALVSDGISQSAFRRELESKVKEAHHNILAKIAGSSENARKLREEVLFAAFSNQPVFIAGESGTGKGLCSAVIHELSKRKDGKFIRYQPSFMSGDLVNSDLFGHKKGAFTGADQDRKGLIEEAASGTLFLDEIDALPVETQVLLLGVLQDKKVRRVGSNEESKSNFRLISASNADINQLIENNKFRKDLFFRVAHLTVTIPPLRERKEDIISLVEATLEELREHEELSVTGISDEALKKLLDHSWPGNIRELQAVVEGAAYRSQFEGRFEIQDGDIRINNNGSTTPTDVSISHGFHEQVSAFKAKLIADALNRNGGNQVHAAKELGLDRSTMRRILNRE